MPRGYIWPSVQAQKLKLIDQQLESDLDETYGSMFSWRTLRGQKTAASSVPQYGHLMSYDLHVFTWGFVRHLAELSATLDCRESRILLPTSRSVGLVSSVARTLSLAFSNLNQQQYFWIFYSKARRNHMMPTNHHVIRQLTRSKIQTVFFESCSRGIAVRSIKAQYTLVHVLQIDVLNYL